MKIVILEPLGLPEERIKNIAKPLTCKGHELITYNNRPEDLDTLLSRSSEADVLVLANMPLSREAILSDKALKMISVAFTGVDHIDMDSCRERKVLVCNAAGYSTSSVAELTFGLIFAVLRNIVPLDLASRSEKTKAGYSQHELYGKTLGIIGTGAIGLKVAEIAKAFGCKIIAYSRTQRSEALALGITYLTLEELLSQSDIITIHVPLNDKSKGLIGSEKLSLVKPSAILINTARGPVVDYKALAEALKKGEIAGAGVDVFEIEPPLPKGHPLFGVPNVVVTPHIGFAAEEALQRRAEITFKNIEKWIEGHPQNLIK